MSGLPRGWVETSLAEISGGITYGFTTKSSTVGDGARLLRITDIQDYKVDWASLPYCDDQPDPAFLVRSGDIVVARTGATTGKSYLIKNVPVPTAFASYLIRIAVSHELQSDYVWKFMQGPDYWQQIQVVSKGTAQPGANAVILGQVAIPLPPLAEQKRIVAKLDALNAKSARARTELARIESLVSRYKQAVLSKAFSGGWCPEEKTNTGPHQGLPTEYNNQVYPASWTITSVGSFAQNHDARRVPIKREDRSVRQGPYPYYGASGPIDFFDDYLFDGTYLLVAEDGANLLSRSSAIAFTAMGRFWVNNHAHILELADQTDHDFLRHYLESISLVPYVTGSAQPKLTQRALAGIGVVVPPPSERAKIVRRIESAFAKIDRLAKEAKRALELVGRLDEAILAKAFRGELVPQDENDEPAEHLLARIRAEREAAPKGKRGRGAKG